MCRNYGAQSLEAGMKDASAVEFEGDGVVTLTFSGPSPTEFSYNFPNGHETDAEILRAEGLFYNTPLTEKYSGAVYYSIKDVQQQCMMDYQKFCGTQFMETSTLVIDPAVFLQEFLQLDPERRRLHSSFSKKYAESGRHLLDFVRTFYLPKGQVGLVRTLHVQALRDMRDRIAKMMGTKPVAPAPRPIGPDHAQRVLSSSEDSSKELSEDQESSFSVFASKYAPALRKRPLDDGMAPLPVPVPLGDDVIAFKPVAQAVLAPRPRMNRVDMFYSYYSSESADQDGYEDDYYSSGSDSDSDDDDDDDHSKRHGRPLPPAPEDRSFPGALGFGAAGDMCLHENGGRLSLSCGTSISRLYSLREQYWAEATTPPPPSGGFLVLLVLGALLLGLLARKVCTFNRRKAVHKLLSGLKGNAALKARVEDELGIRIPEPFPQRQVCSKPASFCMKVVKVTALLLFTFCSSLFITISSLEITSSIVNYMDERSIDPNTGDMAPTSSFTTLAILFLVCTAEVLLLGALIRLAKHAFKSFNRDSSNLHHRPQPSAPLVTPLDDPEFSRNAASAPHPDVRQSVFLSNLSSYFPTNIQSIWTRGRSGSPDGYVPLRAEDTEMVSMAANRPAGVTVYSGVPIQPHQITITATPVNHVSFI